jgi:hypothetical protein
MQGFATGGPKAAIMAGSVQAIREVKPGLLDKGLLKYAA